MIFNLENKNIVITGASSGIGRACAIKCSKENAKVIMIGRNLEKLTKTFNLLKGEGHIIVEHDIIDYDSIESKIKEAVNSIGKIDGFIHSAGIEMTIPLKVIKPSNYLDVISVNTIGGFNLAKIISKKKYINSSSSFVFISSVMSIVGQSGKIAYCASKGALVAGMKAMAIELSNRNIRVNAISPGLVTTSMSNKLLDSLPEISRSNIENMHPLGFGTPENIADSTVFLLSNASSWITGTNLIVDGGYSAQ